MNCFTDNELTEQNYYSRQHILADFGIAGQQRLAQSRVLVVGAGGLGCPALQYLVGAGVGHITIADGDNVHVSNLHRQVLFTTNDIGKNKAQCAATHLREHNPFVHIQVVEEFVNTENIAQLFQNVDVVIDATDNFEARFLVGQFSAKAVIPLVYAAIYGFEGQLTVFNYKQGAALTDLFPRMPSGDALPNCATNGVLGIVSGLLGIMQAIEAIKILTGIGVVTSGKLLLIDVLTLQKREIVIKKRTNEPTNNVEQKTQTMTTPIPIKNISAAQLQRMLLDDADNIVIVDVREPYEYEAFNIGGLLIPLQQIPARINEIPLHKPVVFVCKAGVRSMNAAQFIKKSMPESRLYNLQGGLMAWQ